MGNAIRMAGRVLGAAAIIGEVIIAVGQTVRRTELGFSGRLIDAQDAHTIYGNLDEESTAVRNVRGFFASQKDTLAAVANRGFLGAHLEKAANQLLNLEFRQAQGADRIERDPHFDSADSLIDQAIAKANEAGLKDTAHEVLEWMRKWMWFKGWFK